jgi:hypothetical protein
VGSGEWGIEILALLNRSMNCKSALTLGRVFKPFDPPQPPLSRGENLVKVPLFKGDLGGSKSDREV